MGTKAEEVQMSDRFGQALFSIETVSDKGAKDIINFYPTVITIQAQTKVEWSCFDCLLCMPCCLTEVLFLAPCCGKYCNTKFVTEVIPKHKIINVVLEEQYRLMCCKRPKELIFTLADKEVPPGLELLPKWLVPNEFNKQFKLVIREHIDMEKVLGYVFGPLSEFGDRAHALQHAVADGLSSPAKAEFRDILPHAETMTRQ